VVKEEDGRVHCKTGKEKHSEIIQDCLCDSVYNSPHQFSEPFHASFYLGNFGNDSDRSFVEYLHLSKRYAVARRCVIAI
jgi:hypothetical protein